MTKTPHTPQVEQLSEHRDLRIGTRVYSTAHQQEVELVRIERVTRSRSVGIWAHMRRDDGVEVFHAIGLVRNV